MSKKILHSQKIIFAYKDCMLKLFNFLQIWKLSPKFVAIFFKEHQVLLYKMLPLISKPGQPRALLQVYLVIRYTFIST